MACYQQVSGRKLRVHLELCAVATMSIWKFRLYLIPERGSLPSTNPTEHAGDYPWWADIQPPVGFESQIDSILPVAESWLNSARMWGAKLGGDVKVWYIDDSRTRSSRSSSVLMHGRSRST